MNKHEDEWQQMEIIHCPDSDCKGMLLQSDFKHEMKCSNCKKMFMEITRFEEVKLEEESTGES